VGAVADQTVHKAICGRCGRTYLPPAKSPHTNLCPTCPVPHQLVSRTAAGIDDWRCADCGEIGTMFHLEHSSCTYIHPPCSTCGQHPYCAPDCSAILSALSGAIPLGF
jgi:ribosomal protein L37AE/L43A